MKYQIIDGTVTLGGRTVLSHISFELQGTERLAVVGRNGAGKTTLLRLIAGELELDRDDKRQGPGVLASRQLTVGYLSQQEFSGETRTVEEMFAAYGLATAVGMHGPVEAAGASGIYGLSEIGGGHGQAGTDIAGANSGLAVRKGEYAYEFRRLFTELGFQKAHMGRQISSLSGGERTKLALIRLLLEKPDILLLDEPTNHLDLRTVQWLENRLNAYPGAVVMVSHDRFFLDQTAQAVYELENGRLLRYAGNYTAYREQKRKAYAIQLKAYERQQEEISRQKQLIERFKHKPTKAAFARSRKKMLERMERVEKPAEDMAHIFTGELTPLVMGSKWVMEAEHLKIGYERPLLELSLRVRRGQKIGILGENGSGKTTFLKTVAGFLPPVEGVCSLGNQITIGYFDQFSAAIQSEQTVAEHFSALFPSMTDKQVRTTLGAYLFRGREAARRVSELSGGEKARLVLAELLCARPNLLILDEPTNHMDIQAKETLESAFQAYTGTILFVSHDRYFLRQVARSILIFEEQSAMYYPFGYEHYMERVRKERQGESPAARMKAEEQALIEGLKAVPRAERHRLKELPEEEVYVQWQLRLAAERMEQAGREVEWLEELVREEKERELTAFAARRQDVENLSALCAHHQSACAAWHESCLVWYEAWLAAEGYENT